MGNLGECSPLGRLRGALESADAPAYVKTPSAPAATTVLGAVAAMDDPPAVRLLAGPQLLAVVLPWARADRARAILDERLVEVRASLATITDTTVVTPAGVTRFGGSPDPVGANEAVHSRDGAPFAESVYAAHEREWERAEPIRSPGSARASG